MRITYACPHCDSVQEATAVDATTELRCTACQNEIAVASGTITENRLNRCLICPSDELYARKDFPQRIGISIVVLAVIASSITWYYHQIYLTFGIFFATAGIDFLLWLCMGNMLQCYRCQTQYRDVTGLDEHGGFDLEVHEKHRQQVIRLREAERAAAS